MTVAETSEGAQELQRSQRTAGVEYLREAGSVLRIPHLPEDVEEVPTGDDTMIINMGPQHPSTHGVLRVMMELQGETVLRCKPVMGYLHTGMEKTGEELTYLQGPTNVTRMDYVSPLFNELVFSLATEKLLDIELPPRATWIRMLMCELNRMSSQVLWLATNGMDLGAVSMMIYGFREREMILAFFEKVTGLRMNHNYIRPGGVAADLPEGWRDDVLGILEAFPERLDEYDTLLTGQPIWQERTQGVGVITTEECLALGVTGPDPALHRHAVGPAPRPALPGLRPGRLRRHRRQLRRHLRPLRHPAQRDPGVDQDRPPDPREDALGRLQGAGQEGHPAAPPPHRRVDGSPDPPLQDLHRGLPGARGRGLRGRGVTPGRAGLLHGLRRQRQALPHAHPGPVVRQPPGPAPHDPRRPDRRRRRRDLAPSTPSWARSTGRDLFRDFRHRHGVQEPGKRLRRRPAPAGAGATGRTAAGAWPGSGSRRRGRR